ncbi:MAG: AmmeMemoRadiSam system protein A, partial [Sulfurimonas sp.]
MIDSVLLKIAKSAILEQFNDAYSFDKETLLNKHPFLNKEGAAFVTLKYNGHLRGCIGSIAAYRPLYSDIFQNAKAAAFKDPRFNPLSERELSQINLEVSVLSEPKILEYKDFNDLLTKVEPNVDGLIFKHNGYQGTFLPQVWEQLKSPKEFLEHLSLKAGLSP